MSIYVLLLYNNVSILDGIRWHRVWYMGVYMYIWCRRVCVVAAVWARSRDADPDDTDMLHYIYIYNIYNIIRRTYTYSMLNCEYELHGPPMADGPTSTPHTSYNYNDIPHPTTRDYR